jgi:nicotinate-nucleotide adenylyltransferase
MGEDNLKSLHKWRNYEVLLERYHIYVYPRISGVSKVSASVAKSTSISKIEAPIMELSSTFIRKAIKDKKNIRPMLPQNVWEYLDEMNFYRQ